MYTDVGHVHDAYVRNDTAYLNCGNDGFRIIDFHYLDLLGGSPIELASLTSYPDNGYNHSGWLNHDGTIYAMQDENHGYDVKLLDVSDFNNISVLSTFSSGVDPQSMAHNGIIKDSSIWLRTLEEVTQSAEEAGAYLQDAAASPILGRSGNKEFLLYFARNYTRKQVIFSALF